MCQRCPIECFIPPYINDRLAQSENPALRSFAIANIRASAAMRAKRALAQAMPSLMVSAAPTKTKHRLVYDAQGKDSLPGKLVRSEGQGPSKDKSVNAAYDNAGDTYDFYEEVFSRNSLDGNGMTLTSSVHLAEVDDTGEFAPLNNAFWDGEQMAYGDGDNIIFRNFPNSLDVVGHELTHGVQSFTSNLEYLNQSGALNEHFADVFGSLVTQWSHGETALQASWLIGADVVVPAPGRRAIRDMENPGTAYTNDPDLGTDPQPGHMSNIFTGPRDRGGVHINSGIPNRVFVLIAKAIKGKAWDVAGRIWYDTMVQLTTTSQFIDCARLSVQVAGGKKFGAAAKKAVTNAWKAVGINV